jgi:hypothetical protein
MKRLWRIGVLVLGTALFWLAIERIGASRVRGELEAMSSAIVVIFALSLIRLYLQTQSWSLALKQDGIQSSRIELMFLRLASQGIGYLTVLGPAASEPMKIKLLQHHHRSPTAATLVDTGVYWLTAGLVLIAGSVTAIFAVAHDRGASVLLAAAVAGGIYFLLQPKTVLKCPISALGKHCPGWLAKAADIENELRRFASANRLVIRRMFMLDLVCQALLLAEVASALYCLHFPLTAGTVLSIESAARAVRILGGCMPARIGADEGGAAAAFIALGLPAAGGLALALARRLRDVIFSLTGLVWLASRNHPREGAPVLRGAIECKL